MFVQGLDRSSQLKSPAFSSRSNVDPFLFWGPSVGVHRHSHFQMCEAFPTCDDSWARCSSAWLLGCHYQVRYCITEQRPTTEIKNLSAGRIKPSVMNSLLPWLVSCLRITGSCKTPTHNQSRIPNTKETNHESSLGKRCLKNCKCNCFQMFTNKTLKINTMTMVNNIGWVSLQ